MRTLRLSLAGMVMLALLGGLPALAQEASPPASPSAPPASMAMEPALFAGEDTGGSLRVSDPRVSGIYAYTFGVIPSGAEGGGILTLRGPDGKWVGPWAVTTDSDFPTVSRFIYTLEGTEAYEGWAVVAWVTTPEGWRVGIPHEVEGVIYEGSAPRLEFHEYSAE